MRVWLVERNNVPICNAVELSSYLPLGYTVSVTDPDSKEVKKYRIVSGHLNLDQVAGKVADICSLVVEELQ